jgi:hypothetical protein
MLVSMRNLMIAAAVLAAAPAAAQIPTQSQIDELRFQQETAQRRAIDQQNQLMALDARLRADQATYDLQRSTPRVPELRYDLAPSAGGTAAFARYPSIPDKALADSNRRVQDAVRKPR